MTDNKTFPAHDVEGREYRINVIPGRTPKLVTDEGWPVVRLSKDVLTVLVDGTAVPVVVGVATVR